MALRTVAAALLLAALVVASGCAVLPGDGGLTAQWLSDTGRDVEGNHHPAVGAVVDGEPMVFAPVSGVAHDHEGGHGAAATDHAEGSSGCALVGLDGTTGAIRWQNEVAPANCTIHSVADPTVADADGDGTPEVVAATTEPRVTAYDPTDGTTEFSHPLSLYGYSRPVVTDLTGDGRDELVVVDVTGTV